MDFVALPKIELHAHLTGSISRAALRQVWLRKRAAGQALDLADPLVAMPPGAPCTIASFFPLFTRYIYGLLTDAASVRETALSVLAGFLADGVVYLELRTTPRATRELSAAQYLATLLAAVADFEALHPHAMHTRLVLSVDRRHSLETARSVVELAERLDHRGRIVGLDLCGDPGVAPPGGVGLFTPVFEAADALGLGITLHFAECAAAASREELDTLLSWRPRRLGHVIHEDEEARREIEARGLCLELCLSCNVHAGMVTGGFEGHHFGVWRGKKVKISLGTDDVGIFESPLSNEYRLVAEHFGLDRGDICALARDAIDHIFGGEAEKQRLREIMWT